jgi:hypothetical protein
MLEPSLSKEVSSRKITEHISVSIGRQRNFQLIIGKDIIPCRLFVKEGLIPVATLELFVGVLDKPKVSIEPLSDQPLESYARKAKHRCPKPPSYLFEGSAD